MYKNMRKAGQAKAFHDKISDILKVPRGATENLLKNIGREFRDELKATMVTGAATITPKMRGSAELYIKYEEYQALFYPVGGQVIHTVLTLYKHM